MDDTLRCCMRCCRQIQQQYDDDKGGDGSNDTIVTLKLNVNCCNRAGTNQNFDIVDGGDNSGDDNNSNVNLRERLNLFQRILSYFCCFRIVLLCRRRRWRRQALDEISTGLAEGAVVLTRLQRELNDIREEEQRKTEIIDL